MGVVVSVVLRLQLSGRENKLGSDGAQNPLLKRTLVSCVVITCQDSVNRDLNGTDSVRKCSLSVSRTGSSQRVFLVDGQFNG